MGKARTTKKAMKEKWGNRLFFVPDGTMQYFGGVVEATAYSTRVEGWACDYYEFGDFCLSEGYSPAGKRIMDYDDCVPFYKASREIKHRYLPHEEEEKLFKNLLADFIGTIKEKI
jgi:hypothetical protein